MFLTMQGVVTSVKTRDREVIAGPFPTTKSFEGAWTHNSGNLESLKEQQLVDRDTTDSGADCHAGVGSSTTERSCLHPCTGRRRQWRPRVVMDVGWTAPLRSRKRMPCALREVIRTRRKMKPAIHLKSRHWCSNPCPSSSWQTSPLLARGAIMVSMQLDTEALWHELLKGEELLVNIRGERRHIRLHRQCPV